jgi:class 3 adenylate cyclase
MFLIEMPSIILNDVEKIISEVSKFGELDSKLNEFYRSMGENQYKNKTNLETIVIFDLAGSTSLKLKIGHMEAMHKILLHDKICKAVIKRFNGEVLKETGDGVVASFKDPLSACLAALNTIEIANRKEISTKAALVLGITEKIKLSNKIDVFGISMDICSHLEKYAIENQILINNNLYDTAMTFLKNYDDVLISNPISVNLRGYGETKIYEIASKRTGLRNRTKYQPHVEDKQLSTTEKIELIKNAKAEIIEIGEGFQDIAYNLDDRSFSDFIKDILRSGINIRFIITNPNLVVDKNSTPDYEVIIISQGHFMMLKKLQNEVRNEKLSGMFEIYVYEKPVPFTAIGIDSNQDDGVILVSNHLPGITRSKVPHVQITKTSHPVMFNSHVSSIKFLIDNSKSIDSQMET